MYKLVVAFALFAVALGDVSHLPGAHHHHHQHVGGPVVAILRQSSDIQPDGSYQWAYETENGIAAQEQASVRVLGPEEAEKQAQGSYSYTSPEGEQVSVQYVADANGYQPQGSHIPVSPPIPAAIQKALEYILAHPQKEERRF